MRQAQFTKPLTITLSEDQYAKVKDLSDEQRISMSDLIRKVLDHAFTEHHITGGANGHGTI